MSQRIYPTFLHKSEWERLKKQGGPLIPETATHDSKKAYLDALNEQSRKWMDLWPDSAEGVREKLKELKRKQRKENKVLLDWYKSRKQEDPQVVVKRAKQLIFDDSCYGRQLISAVVESNILEEREAQIEFQTKIKQQEAELEKDKKYNDSPLITNVTDEEIQANRKLAAIECVKFNEEMERTKKEKAVKSKAEKVICESVDEDLKKLVREFKTKNKAEKKTQENKGLEEYEAERKRVAKYRKISEDRNNALTAAYKKEQDTLKCKIDAVYKKIVEEKRHGGRAQKLYKEIDEIQKAETKRYNDFIEKGIEMQEQGYLKQEAKESEIENKKHIETYKVAEENQIAGKLQKLYIEYIAPGNKCVCDVQTLLFKPDSEKQILKKNREKFDAVNDMQIVSQETVKKKSSEDDSVFKPSTNLVQALRQREKEPSGYTGGDAKDKYFAEQASDALQRTKHKYFARKVIDGYIKETGLKASDLSIANY